MFKCYWLELQWTIQDLYLWVRAKILGKDDHLRHLSEMPGSIRRHEFIRVIKIKDFQFWDTLNIFSAHQASCLISGYSPGFYQNDYPLEVKARELELLSIKLNDDSDFNVQMQDLKNNRRLQKLLGANIDFSRDDLKHYCFQNTLEPPFLFPNKRESRAPVEIELSETKTKLAQIREKYDSLENRASTPYLDPKHASYSTELNIAISTWLALFKTGEDVKRKYKKGATDQIEEYLFTNYPAIKDKIAIQRFRTLCNPDRYKRGGQ